MIRGLIGAVVAPLVAWLLMTVAGVAGPDSGLLEEVLRSAWGLVVDCLQWLAGAQHYPQRAVLVVAMVWGFVSGAGGK